MNKGSKKQWLQDSGNWRTIYVESLSTDVWRKLRVILVRTLSVQYLSSGLNLEQDRWQIVFSLSPNQPAFNSRGCPWLKMKCLNQFRFKTRCRTFPRMSPAHTNSRPPRDGQGLAPYSWILVFFKACFQTMNVGFHMFTFPFEVNCFLAYIPEVRIYLQCRSILSYRSSRKLKYFDVRCWNYLK